MKYIVSYQNPNTHYIDIEFIIDQVNIDSLNVQLPSWRPGRYELGNFAKNVQKWDAFDQDGHLLNSKKITKDCWEIETKKVQQVHIKYNYFAHEINAGSSYLDDRQLYINGVNCFLYVPDRMYEQCELQLNIPSEYKVASGLKETVKHQFICKDFHELVDCPLIASDSLQHHVFEESSIKFHLWFQGECKPDWELLENDFRKFSKVQIKAFGDFPVIEYHFLFQILTHKAYHGVEHTNSTVIALGPSYDIMNKKGWYKELLGVSSHELYHTWNVKQIRPIEMFPYDYSQENYTVMGYLDEGVTTYYGDKFLLTSQVFNWEEYAETFDALLAKHFNNFGVNNYSVAQSSFDTWLDGYVKGTPGRKGSIYTEGALIAFITDVFILKSTNNQKSLNDVMKILYDDFAKQGKGIADIDYKNVVEQVAGASYDNIYHHFIHGNKDYKDSIKESLTYIGCDLKIAPSDKVNEAMFGLMVKYENSKCLVDTIYPGSISEEKGLSIDDEIVAINGIPINHNLTEWCTYFKADEIGLSVKRKLGVIEKIKLKATNNEYFKTYTIVQTENNLENFKIWSS